MKLYRLFQKLPPGWRKIIDKIPVSFFTRQYARKLERTFESGPPYRPSHRSIIIDITEACDLGCVDCSRSCANYQAPSESHMTLQQIQRFIDESYRQGRKWEIILIEGGEPTLHPEFLDIVHTLSGYLKKESPRTVLQVNTNGFSETSRRIIGRIPPGVNVYSSAKKRPVQDSHLLFNLAPKDLDLPFGPDYSQGCYLPAFYGLGLNRYGYYPHPNCGSIDRVFGFDIGRKSLPRPDDKLEEHFSSLCRYCGMFLYFNRAVAGGELRMQTVSRKIGDKVYPPGSISGSWEKAYKTYAENKPLLGEY